MKDQKYNILSAGIFPEKSGWYRFDFLDAKIIKIPSYTIPKTNHPVCTNEHTLVIFVDGHSIFLENIGLDVSNTQILHIPVDDPSRADLSQQIDFELMFNEDQQEHPRIHHPQIMKGAAIEIVPVELEIYNRNGIVVFFYMVLGMIEVSPGRVNTFIINDYAQPFHYRIIRVSSDGVYASVEAIKKSNVVMPQPRTRSRQVRRFFYMNGINFSLWAKSAAQMGRLLAREDTLKAQEPVSRGDVEDLEGRRLDWLLEYARAIYRYPNLIPSNEHGWIDVEATARRIHTEIGANMDKLRDKLLIDQVNGFFRHNNLHAVKAKRRECVEQLILDSRRTEGYEIPAKIMYEFIRTGVVPLSRNCGFTVDIFSETGLRFCEVDRPMIDQLCSEMEQLGFATNLKGGPKFSEGDTLLIEAVRLNSAR